VSTEDTRSLAPPAGFTEHTRTSPLTTPWAPIFRSANERSVFLGVYLREGHCNSRGLVHGGFIAALADNTMGYTAGKAIAADGREIKSLVTINLAVDYLGSAKADGLPVARANATFKIID